MRSQKRIEEEYKTGRESVLQSDPKEINKKPPLAAYFMGWNAAIAWALKKSKK
jgi:hypothetical protein